MNTENNIAAQMHTKTIDLQAVIILNQQRDIDRLNSLAIDSAAEIARLNKVIEWLQGQTGKIMGAAAKADIAAASVRAAEAVPPSLLIRAYNSGYMSGHNDTVEGQYTDIDQRDMFTYHADVVADMIADGTLAAPAAPAEQAEPVGYKLVPIRPTDAMNEAYNNVPSGFAGSPPHCSHVWDAMLAAAPAASLPAQPEQTQPQPRLRGVMSENSPLVRAHRQAAADLEANVLRPSAAPASQQDAGGAACEDEIVGHKTFSVEGGGFRHEPLRRGEADAIMAQVEASKRRRIEMMPDELAARLVSFDAWLRLKELGWSEAIYCPKDGSEFEVIEAGSTGVHRCVYWGEWPSGSWWILGDGDMYPSRPVLYRQISETASAPVLRMDGIASKESAKPAAPGASTEDKQ